MEAQQCVKLTGTNKPTTYTTTTTFHSIGVNTVCYASTLRSLTNKPHPPAPQFFWGWLVVSTSPSLMVGVMVEWLQLNSVTCCDPFIGFQTPPVCWGGLV